MLAVILLVIGPYLSESSLASKSRAKACPLKSRRVSAGHFELKGHIAADC